ncbi:MAG TPA: helicase HerA-like domain-containing protein, partial [Xanthomonadales bacterium]|nr:helicase HerA-like domain-containing protein [Xanthomonadales bacterium]
RAAATTFRSNPDLDVEQVITQLGVGEALVSMLEAKGVPSIVDRCLIRPPTSRIGPASESERSEVRSRSPVGLQYDTTLDRESASEILLKRAEEAAKRADSKARDEEAAKAREKEEKAASKPHRSTRESPTEAAFKSMMRSMGTSLGRALTRGILGALKK